MTMPNPAIKPVLFHLKPQDWMIQPQTQRLIDAFDAADITVRFVGGCVRDAVIGKPVSDIDLATLAWPQQVMAALTAAGIGAHPTGLSHGTITAVVDHKPFEVTTLRRDVETDGRWAKVSFTDNWAEDAARRDFTMNALFCTTDGTVYDYCGGLDDLRAGVVRFVGRAQERIAEDVLRLLRFFRFFAHYGRGDPHPEALTASIEAAPKLVMLSGERVREELRKLLHAPDPRFVLHLMMDRGILPHVLPSIDGVAKLDALIRIEAPHDWLLRLGTLIESSQAAARRVADRLRLSNRDQERLVAMMEGHPINMEGELSQLRRIHYRLGSRTFCDRLWLSAAKSLVLGSPIDPDWVARTDSWGQEPPKEFPLKGADLLVMGMAPGPAVGKILKQVEDWWINQDFKPDHDGCLRQAREWTKR